MVKYYCPDCDKFFASRAILIRCKYCASLNLERNIVSRFYLKADAEFCLANLNLVNERIPKEELKLIFKC